MTAGLPEPFPCLSTTDDEDRNPAIRLFGKRFFSEQSAVELLAEFLSVVCCEKYIENVGSIDAPLPGVDALQAWPRAVPLRYRPPIKLNLKLFALLGASPAHTRHPAHMQHYESLTRCLQSKIRTNDGSEREVVEWLEELMQGLQGVGANRTWCAQTFFPVSRGLLTQETLWNDTVARGQPASEWHEYVEHFLRYFSVSRHRFLARGGELLYLQLCNALIPPPNDHSSFINALRQIEPLCISLEEQEPTELCQSLDRGLSGVFGRPDGAFEVLIDTLDGLDQLTQQAVEHARHADQGWLACGWCPRDSWKEGYLFAIEVSRVLAAPLDPVERLEILVVGCALQVLRSLCAQSARYVAMERAEGPWGYAWVMTPPEGASAPLRIASQRNLQVVQRMIYQALRGDALAANASGARVAVDRLYREADRCYGHKLLLSLGKRLGLIVPKSGRGARWVMTDEVLRYLVLALLPPGKRCTYDTFLRRLYLHYGMAVEEEALDGAVAWSGLAPNRTVQPGKASWLAAMLRAGGFLTDLSDACAVVRNPYEPEEDGARGGAA
jgi:hypothetical protein